jgi:hydrophobic/amphiphilic exporter-1 (mainly G- bacteria), HAE1 family
LPSDFRRFLVLKFSTGDQPVLGLRVSSDRDLSNSWELLDRKIVRALERLPGVARVDLRGVQPPELRIELKPDRLTASGVDVVALNQLIAESNFAASAGLIREGELRWRVQPNGELTSLESLENLVINAQGLRLSDVADISLKPQRREEIRRLDMRNAIGIDVFKERGANLVDVGKRALAAVQEIGNSPEMAGIEIYFIQDQGKGVTSSLAELAEAGLLGLILSLGVLYFFLRHWPSTLMVSLAIPICFAMTLACMYFFGVTLNILSMMGLLLGIGMLVDNAVVVVESIYQYREKYPDRPVYCAIEGTRAVNIAISAGTLTSIVVFLPNIFGETNFISIYLAQVAITITISLLASWLVAVSLIPMISARIQAPKFLNEPKRTNDWRERYADALRWTLRNRGKTLLLIALLMGLSGIPMKLTNIDMLPAGETREMELEYDLNGVYALSVVEPSVAKVEQFLLDRKAEFEIKSVYSYFNERGDAVTRILLTDGEDAEKSPVDIMEAIRKDLPKIPIGEVQFEQSGRGGSSEGFSVSIIGESNAMLRDLEPMVARTLAALPELRDVKPASGSVDKEMQVRIDRDKAALYGFNAQQIASLIGVALRGAPMREFKSATGEVQSIMSFTDGSGQSLEDLQDFKLRGRDGELVPLSSLITVTVAPSANSIGRLDRQTSLQLNVNVAPDSTSEKAREAIKKALDGLPFPAGYGWSYGASFGDAEDAGKQMGFNTLIALVMIYFVMAAVFESLLFPLAILGTIAFSIAGVFWTFWISGTTFSIMASIGILILMGVVVNNGIVMVEHINALRRSGLPREEALVIGSRDRLRPIVMTMGTTVLGMLPLCFGSTQIGGDGPPYFPMARAIVGGLIFATIVSLLMLPTMYAMLDDLQQWSVRVWTQARAGLRPSASAA